MNVQTLYSEVTEELNKDLLNGELLLSENQHPYSGLAEAPFDHSFEIFREYELKNMAVCSGKSLSVLIRMSTDNQIWIKCEYKEFDEIIRGSGFVGCDCDTSEVLDAVDCCLNYLIENI